jgi:hypothetical protein
MSFLNEKLTLAGFFISKNCAYIYEHRMSVYRYPPTVHARISINAFEVSKTRTEKTVYKYKYIYSYLDL